ncbi:MAG: DUF5666 domain-containing protein [Arenicellales bacterium]
MKFKYLFTCMGLALAAGGLTACGGGGGGGGTTGTSASISSVGTISGFGSIYVNGIKYETGGATYRVDDEDEFDDSSLAVGMKVKVEGSVNDDGRTGTANRVLYDDDVEGPIDTGSLTIVDANTRTFTVLGLLISAHATSTVYDDGASFDGLAEGQILEISGYFDGNQIVASRIEKQSDLDDEFELKGNVANYDGSSVTLTLQNGVSAGPYSVSGTAELDIPADPVGLFVEIKLIDQGGSLLVIKIETDDEDLLDDDDDEVSVRGILEDDGIGGFLINGVSFTVGDSTEYEPESLKNNLVAGMEIKVEGDMQGNVLIADEVESEHGDIEIEARVIDVVSSDTKNGTVTVDLGNGQSLSVQTDNSTQFEDESASDLNDDESFNLDELAVGVDFVEIEAYRADTGQLVATSIEREDTGRDTRLEAPVDGFDTGVSVTLLGITYSVDGGTSYELNDVSSGSTAFFSALDINDSVKVTDIQPDGTAEELDLED